MTGAIGAEAFRLVEEPSRIEDSFVIADPLLSVTDLTVSFGSHTVIRGLTFQVKQGEAVAIIGPNGAGKTVLQSL